MRRRAWAVVCQLVCVALSSPAGAQAPDEHWRTIRTPHFDVHFPADLESVARRGAGSAERAYGRLAPQLRPARGRIDLVVTDHVDYSNGYAYVSPSPRMVIFARPPVDDRTLRFREDWLDLVVQHELVHVFQLDRTRGWWRAAQMVFGRQPLLFPNMWAPSWLLEGLAVHYESELGDGGRIEGLSHVPYVNAAALDDRLPRFGAWSVATLDFPGGSNAYIYGSFLVQAMDARGGEGSVERFVERTSGRLVPWSFERAARRDFGTTFAAQWRLFADSLRRAVSLAEPRPATTARTAAAWFTRFPRRASDGSIWFVASDGRDVAGLYRQSPEPGAAPVRIARRNTLEPNVALRDGRVIFAQSEWTDPWRLRADLWIREADGRERQLTHGARLFAPDARAADGAIVAVQNVPGTTRLVRVDARGAVTPITSASLDTTWSAPRWSHDGASMVATRWVHGGTMAIVLLDSLGRAPRVLAAARATIDEPSFSLDDRTVFFSVNGTGTATVWAVDVATGALSPGTPGATSMDSPEPTGSASLAAIETRGRGERLVSTGIPTPRAGAALPTIPDTRPSPVSDSATGAVQRYHPLRQLVPRYWLPNIETSDENRTRWGALIAGADIVGRHSYTAVAMYEPVRRETTGSVAYRYAGFGLPLIDLEARQTIDHTGLVDSASAPVGVLARRRRFVGASVTWLHQRVRNMAVVSGGAELELRDFTTDPAGLIGQLGMPLFLQTLKYPTLSLSAGWSNTRSPILAFGREDGIGISGSARLRWRTDDPTATRSTTYIGMLGGYKSLGFIPGPAHHVLALRGVVGTSDEKTNTQLEAGGVSGASAEIAPGLVVGDVRRNFYVRGFAPAAQRGIRAVAGSAEWRAPLFTPGWGRGFVPFFAQRLSATAFADAGAAWCPAGVRRGTVACPAGETPRAMMTSVGAELTLDAALLDYDSPYRMRFGYARPMQGTSYADSPNGSVYFSLGLSF